MALQSSGAIDFSDINVELDNSASAQLNIGGTDARDLAEVSSGAISMSDFYGKSSVIVGQASFTSGGTWVAPTGVTSVSIVAIGAGVGGRAPIGGGGGALAYKNNYTVTPGGSYDVTVGGPADYPNNAGPTNFRNGPTTVVEARGAAGTQGGSDVESTGDAAFRGGNGGYNSGGGGTAGYDADGNSSAGGSGKSGANVSGNRGGGGGGGVSIFGEGPSGTTAGQGGSGGTNGRQPSPDAAYGGRGGDYGAGGGGGSDDDNDGGPGGYGRSDGSGQEGALRIMWPGDQRSFPATNAGNLSSL